MILCINAAYASNIYQVSDTLLVKGTVTNGNNPLHGVSVTLRGRSRIGVVTDPQGTYSLRASGNDVLVFTYTGYFTQEINIDDKALIDVIMIEDIKSMSEVIVVGYGTQKRENIIGSIANISGAQIETRAVPQLREALAGQLPGVIVTQRGGRPGVPEGRVSVRGVGSFGANPDALILVDGIIVGGDWNDIDPNDIESISVLKDASSSAIYGSRAANGVILITTKSGKSGAPKLSLHSYVAKQKPTEFPEFVNSWEYQQAFYEAENGTSELTPDQIAEIEKYRAQNDPNYPNNGFLKKILSKDGFQTAHNLSVTGGGNNNKYNLSLGYLFQDGMVVKNNYSRYNVRFNTTTNLSPKFILTTGISTIISQVKEPMAPASVVGYGPGMLNIIDQAARLPNKFVDVYPNGDFGLGLGGTGTQVSDLASKSFYRQKVTNLLGNLRLDYKIIQNLKLSFISGYRNNINREKTFRSTLRLNDNVTLGPNLLTEDNATNEYYTFQGIADFSKQIGKHFMSLLGGYSFEESRTDNMMAFRDNLPSDDLPVLQLGSPSNQQSNGSGAEYALESQFARGNYSYASKYLVEAVVRRDGSSRFPTNRKYAIFPSFAAGWRLGEERFIKDNFDWINEFKLKASWGILGNQNISNYPYQNTLVSNMNYAYSFGGTVFQGAARNTIVDSTLHWESTRTKDVGLEVSVHKRKINFSITYFDRYTYDILYSPAASVSNVLGFGLSQRNTGKLSNKGWEFTAGYNNSLSNFTYNVNANLTILENKVLDLGVGNIVQPNGMIGNGSSLFIGYPASGGGYGVYYGYVADGLFINEQDIADYEKVNNQQSINPNPKPGDIRYKDISGPGGKPDSVINATYDRVVLGSELPKYSYGVSIGARYAGFDFSMLLQGIGGVTGRLQGYAAWALYNNQGNIQRWQYQERWTEQNPNRNASYPRIENIPGTGVPNTTLSSFWLLNGSYLRIKNIQLGYNVPAPALKNIRISGLRVYLSGENLKTFSHYRKGWDPEIIGNSNYYPIMSTYTFGFNVNF